MKMIFKGIVYKMSEILYIPWSNTSIDGKKKFILTT